MKRWLILLGLLLAPWTAWAQIQEWQAFGFFGLTGGLNDSFDTTSLAPTEASDLQNVVFSTSGAITKRQGTSYIFNTSLGSTATLTGLSFYRQADGDRFLTAVVERLNDDAIVYLPYGSGTTGPTGAWQTITPTGFAITTEHQADFATAFDDLVIEDGNPTTPPYTWSGSGTVSTLSGSAPNSTMVEFHRRHLWTAGRSDFQSRVTFSNLDDHTTFTNSDYIEVETDDGQVVTGIKSSFDCLYVFKTQSIWRICGPERDNFVLQQMVRGTGAASNGSIAIINNQFVFLTSDGNVAVYDGGRNVQIISGKIEGTLSQVDLDGLHRATASPFDDGTGDEDYYLCLPRAGSGSNNLVLVYDTFHRAWTKFAGLTCNSLTPYELGTTEQALALGDNAGYASRYPVGTSDGNGSAISAYYQTGHLRFEELPELKKFRKAQVFVVQTSQNLTFGTSVNFAALSTSTIGTGSATSLWDSAYWDAAYYSDQDTGIRLVEIDKLGDFLLWRIEDSSTNEGFVLRGLRVWAESTGRLGGS